MEAVRTWGIEPQTFRPQIFNWLYCFSKVRRKLQSQVLVSLCVTLISLLLLVVFAVEKKAYTSLVMCQTIAGSVHFLILSSFSWMIVEGYHLHTNIVSVFTVGGGRSYYLKALLFCICKGFHTFYTSLKQLNISKISTIFKRASKDFFVFTFEISCKNQFKL